MTDVKSSNQETNRDKVLRGEVVKVTDDRLREMQEQARRMMGVGDTDYHWHWSAVINELIARRADETTDQQACDADLEEIANAYDQGPNGTFEYDSSNILKMLREVFVLGYKTGCLSEEPT